MKHEQPQQRSARFEDIQNISKHYYFAFPNWCLQKRLVKNDSTIFKNLQTTRQVWKSCRFCRFCRFFGLLDLAFLPFSASWTTAGSVAITSNHKFFSAGSTVYCLLLWSVMIFLCNARFCRWPSKVLPLRSLGQNVRALGCIWKNWHETNKNEISWNDMKWHERLWDKTSMRSWPGDVMWCVCSRWLNMKPAHFISGHGMTMCVGQRGDLLSQFFLLFRSSWVNDRMATWMETCHISEELSFKRRWVSHVASHPFSLTNCASTCLKHDKIRFYQFIKCQQN